MIASETCDNRHVVFPLCFTCAHNHIYWHCKPEDIQSIANKAKSIKVGGAMALKYIHNDAAQRARKHELEAPEPQEKMFCKMEKVFAGTFDGPQVIVITDARDVEDLFREHAWVTDGGEPCTADEERLCARLLAELRVNTSLLCTLRTPTAAEAAANNDRGGRKKPKGELEAALKAAGKADGVK